MRHKMITCYFCTIIAMFTICLADMEDLAKWPTAKARINNQTSSKQLPAENVLEEGCGNYTCTGNETSPWLEIDLGINAHVHSVSVRPLPGWEAPVRILLSLDEAEGRMWSQCDGKGTVATGRPYTSFACRNEPMARFVVVQQIMDRRTQQMCLCEVTIMGVPWNFVKRNLISDLNTDMSKAVNGNWDDYACARYLNRQMLVINLVGTVDLQLVALKVRYSDEYDISTRMANSSFTSCGISPVQMVSGDKHFHMCESREAAAVQIKDIFDELCINEIEIYGHCAFGYYGTNCAHRCWFPRSCI